MPDRRKHRLSECRPQWIVYYGKEGDAPDAVYFDCPEGHENCRRVIPFTPALDGTSRKSNDGRVVWQRTFGQTFEDLTLNPSIRGIPSYASREAAIAAGCLPEYVTESMMCAIHIFIRDGAIDFCGDSK